MNANGAVSAYYLSQKHLIRSDSLLVRHGCDRLFEELHVHGLGKMREEAGPSAALDILLHAEAAQCDPEEIGMCFVELRHEVIAVPIRQADVGDHEVEVVLLREFPGSRNIRGGKHLMSTPRQQPLENRPGRLVVFYEKDTEIARS